MVGYLFAGQGSQCVGMGKDLYETFSESKAVFDKADTALGFSITNLCFNGPQEELTKTINCQPAILTISIAAWEAFKAVTKSPSYQITDYVAGLSLGEYSALVAAGAMNFEDAVCLVRRRGELMEDEAANRPGRMLSVIGLELSKVKQICSECNTEIANINCPGQIVISGGIKEIENAQGKAKELGAKMAVILEVSGAFHSSFMNGATVKLAAELAKININEPKLAFVSNVSAKQTKLPGEIKDNLIKQVASSVLWEDSMRLMLSQGVSKFYEFGPGRVLKGLMRRIEPSAQVVSIEKKEDIEKAVYSS